jgi:hypothetical protein
MHCSLSRIKKGKSASGISATQSTIRPSQLGDNMLDLLKRSLEADRLYTPPTTHTPASHDDPTLLCAVHLSLSLSQLLTSISRFLRARKFDVPKAHKQFAATEAWRHKHDVANLYATFDSDELESSKRFYPRWTGRRDKVRQRGAHLSSCCK